MCGVWLDIQIVYSSVPGLYQPMSPRASIGLGMSRWLTIRWRTTTSAPSTAASVPVLVADGPLEDDVVRGVLVELRRARLGRLLGVDDGRQRLLVDVDGVERVGGLLGRLGDDRRDALAGPLDARRWRGCAGVFTLFWMPARAAGRPGHRERVVGDVGADDRRPARRASPSRRWCRWTGCWRGRTGCAGWPCGPSTGSLMSSR